MGAAMMCWVAGAAAAADKFGDLQARFDHEKNPVHRAKLLEKLGDAEFDEARRETNLRHISRPGQVDLEFANRV